MKKNIDNIRKLFESGNYEAVVAKTVNVNKKMAASNLAYLVGAYGFLGDSYKAVAYFNELREGPPSDEIFKANLFLAIMYARHHDALKALNLVIRNLAQTRKSSSHVSRAYGYLGASFFRYTYGRLHCGLKFAELAYSSGIRANDTYLKFLAVDLIAHCKLGLGHTEQGFALLEEAKIIASKLGQGANLQASISTLLLYKSTLGLISDPVKSLSAHCKTISSRDSYMIAQCQLECARHEILAGKVTQAYERLLAIKDEVFSRGNLRLMSLHQLRLAHCRGLQGDLVDALLILKNGIFRLDAFGQVSDLRLRLSFLGLMYKLEANASAAIEINQLTKKSGSKISARIAERTLIDFNEHDPMMHGLDPLGDLIDRASRDIISVYEEVISSGYLGLLRDNLTTTGGTDTEIFLGLPKNGIVVSNRGDVWVLSNLSTMQQRFLMLLSEDSCSNSVLAESVWGEEYKPVRHDHLIASFASRFRRILSRCGHDLLRKIDGSWKLHAKLRNFDCNSTFKKFHLNFRQREIIAAFADDKKTSLSIKSLEEKIDYPKRTLQRDCQFMVSDGLLKKQGRGKSLTYQLENIPPEALMQ